MIKILPVTFILTISFLIPNALFAQSSWPLSENDSLYVKTIQEYIVEHEKRPYKYIPKNHVQKTLYIDVEDWTPNLPNFISDYKIIIVTPKNRATHYKKNKNKLLTLSLFPLSIENKTFVIGINEFYSQMKGKSPKYLRIGMWTRTLFTYENGKLRYLKSEFGGVY
ncbi:hypothetical protein [Flavobacterium sp.]|uniref:hypothetical protein n=1 Tax=Flavobacterium sp. TaxID=239 RepID=UPI0039E41A90